MRVGQAVMGIVNPRRPQGGAHAEYICVPEASLATLPEGCDLAAASTVPMNGLTARMALEALGLAPGSTLLVTGGAGAVGGYVISLARLAGLHVVADAKESDRELLLSLGAEYIVPRGEGMASSLRERYPDDVDAVVDCALLGDAAAALVRNGGSFVSLRRSQVITDSRLRRITIGVLDQVANTPALDWLAQRFDDGTLKPRVAQQLPASEGAEAHRVLEQGGLRGRLVIVF
jgi:NADPH:quinone reductase-like Zn-dependent oxidoreductase